MLLYVFEENAYKLDLNFLYVFIYIFSVEGICLYQRKDIDNIYINIHLLQPLGYYRVFALFNPCQCIYIDLYVYTTYGSSGWTNDFTRLTDWQANTWGQVPQSHSWHQSPLRERYCWTYISATYIKCVIHLLSIIILKLM